MTIEIQKTEEKIARMLSSEGIAGCAVAITDRERTLYAHGFGVCDASRGGPPVSERTIFRAASITKVVTGMTAMQLVEQGLIGLDVPVRHYLPWLALSSEEAARSMTVRHLMSHTSGLPTEYTPDGPHDEAMLLPSLMEGLPALSLVSMPGEGKYLYSNWGFRLLGAIIEAVSGDRYSDIARRMVLEPAGMRDSGLMLSDAMRADLAMPHVCGDNGEPIPNGEVKENYCRLSTGGLCSNALDIARLCRVLLRGGVGEGGARIVSEASLAEMMREHATLEFSGYGLAMQRQVYDGRTVFGHYGSAPPYSSAMYADTEAGFGAVVLINTDAQNLRRDICAALFSALPR